jgi:hypothetical protein
MPKNRVKKLVREKGRLLAQIAELENQIKKIDSDSGLPKRLVPIRPVRELVLDALDDIGIMVHTNVLRLYLQAKNGRAIAPTRFGTLSKDEELAHIRFATERTGRHRVDWLCHGLTSDRGEAIRRFWARASWPLADRIVAPTSGRVMHYKITMRLAEIASENADTCADPDMLKFLAADHARDLPGIDKQFRKGVFDFQLWIDTAKELLTNCQQPDLEEREAAAQRLGSRIGEHHLLFGVPELYVLEGGMSDEKEKRG